MNIFLVLLISATIPQGWPMLRCNQQRTGYTPGVSCFIDSMYEKWSFLVQDEKDIFYSSPVSADFSSDGKNDILVGSFGGYDVAAFPTAELYRGYDGFHLWSSATTTQGPFFSTPALMDVTGDDIPEVFLYEINPWTAPYPSRLACRKGTDGTKLWDDTTIHYSLYCAPLVIEGSPGTVISGDTNGILYSSNATTGIQNWQYNVGKHIQPPSLGDVDNDGVQELVVIAGTALFVFELSGPPPIWTFTIGDSATTPMLVNLDADPELEIVIYAYKTGYIKAFNYYNSATPIINKSVGAFTPDFSNTSFCEVWAPSPAGGDITGDGTPEIFIHNGNTIYCLDGVDGDSIWAVPATHLFGSPVLADLDNDGYLEIVVTGSPGDNNYRSKVECYEHTGIEKWEWKVPIGGGYPDPIANEACLTDLDDDANLEIVTVDFSCWLLALACDTTAGIEETQHREQPISIVNSIFTDRIELIAPNLSWGCMEYSLYDIGGRLVQTGNVTIDRKGTIYLHKIKPGIYFLQLKLPDTNKTFKLLKLL